MDVSQYTEVFNSEAIELLQSLNETLLALEKNPDDLKPIEAVFRAVHTLKGMAATMNYTCIAQLSHQMENLLDRIRKKECVVSPSLTDLLFECVDVLQNMIERVISDKSDEFDISELIENLKNETEKNKGNSLVKTSTPTVSSNNLNYYKIKIFLEENCALKSVRVYMVFKCLNELGEVVKSIPSSHDLEDEKFNFDFEVYLRTKKQINEIRKTVTDISDVKNVEIELFKDECKEEQTNAVNLFKKESVAGSKKTQTVRVNIGRLDNIMNLVGELVINKAKLDRIAFRYEDLELDEILDQLKMILNDLQNEVVLARMVPIGHIFDRFPRMARDLSRELEKEINFVVEGKEIELDRTVLDEIGDPLMHLLRNAVGHGVEMPDERERIGKARTGMVILSARGEKNNAIIEIVDDGRGMNPAEIRRSAIKKGFISEDEADMLDEEESLRLICLPGFSTAKETTSLSGRGVGVDVVKTKIEALGGSMEIKSKLGSGTKFILRLPFSLAIIQALLVKVKNETYAIPLSDIVEIVELKDFQIKTVKKEEVFVLHDAIVPLIHLEEVFGIKDNGKFEIKNVHIIVVEIGEKRKGLVVDKLIGQQEIVIKPLEEVIGGIMGIAGAAILGDGKVALVLDVRSLLGLSRSI
ncbi:MAG: chemotaxis protein CheA [Actinobacteria bacterium]|nr:chemotaxis protein CheA [Actinomycetota bacterium]